MAITGLAPAVYVPDLCVYRYPVGTRSADCQKFCDQAFGYFYSYVWMEAARSFETALAHDPDCAVAWLGLHNALEKWGRSATPKPDPLFAAGGTLLRAKLPDRFDKAPKDYALGKARELLPRTSHRESLLVTAKLHEKGMMPGTGPDDRRRKAQQTLDELVTLYPDDEEGWFARAQLGDGPHGRAPFFHALLKVNPLHPGANHEFVHLYENIRRPALGWPYAEAYIKSSPGIPHAFHMQAHLAMRVGKWTHTTDWSWKAVELEKAYHKLQGVKHGDDHQFFHHLETLTRSLVHDGRFAEAKRIKAEAVAKYNYHFRPEWFRMAVAEKDWAEAEKIAAYYRKLNKPEAAYFAAVLALERGDAGRARAEVEVLRQAQQAKRGDRRQELRIWEVQGRLECQTGNGETGLKLLKRTIDKTKDDYAHHAWGGGAYFMEVWGLAALEAGNAAEAEEAFQEGLAHDAGSVRGALGLWAVCDRLGRTDEAARYLKVARRCWGRAEPHTFAQLQQDLAKKAARIDTRQETRVTRHESRRRGFRLVSPVSCLLSTAKADPCVSGVPVGKRPGPYSFLVATGPQRGQQTCYVCEQADRPTAVVFARSLSDPLGKLLAKLDAETTARKDAGFKAWMTQLTDTGDLDALARWAKQQGLKNVPVGAFEDADGPPAYKINAQADVTVLLFVKQKVVANFAFRPGELTDEAAAEVAKALPKLFEKK